MARFIDADSALSKLQNYHNNLEADKAMLGSDRMAMTIAVEECIAIIDDLLNEQKEVVAVLPQDYHDRCMELEINRRFAAEEKVSEYPRVLDAIHGELTNAIGLVERLQNLSLAEKTSDKSDE